MNRRIAVTLLASVALAGCASLGLGGFRQPEVRFQDVKIRGLGLSGGALDVVLSVYNPNGFNLNGTRLTYRLLVGEDQELGTGAVNQPFRVRDKDNALITIPVDFTYRGLGAAGRQLLSTGAVNYRVLGDITLDTPVGNFTVPYDQRGRFAGFSGASQSR